MTHTEPACNLAYYVFGTGTDVGKTLFCATISRLARASGYRVRYLKPVQTGWPTDDDARTVRSALEQEGGPTTETDPAANSEYEAVSIWTYPSPVSPHRAVGPADHVPSDREILEACRGWLGNVTLGRPAQGNQETKPLLQLIEGAGGALSPLPSGSLTADALRPLRLPVILVAEWRLGGISQTLSTIEALQLRGFEIALVVFFGGKHENGNFVKKYLEQQPGTGTSKDTFGLLPAVVTLPFDLGITQTREPVEYLIHGPGRSATESCLGALQRAGTTRHKTWERINRIATESFWWPFTQHAQVGRAIVVDDAMGSYLGVVNQGDSNQPERQPEVKNVFDGSASWWTLGMGHGHPALALSLAHAAGRYGHVLFPGQAHAPAAGLAEQLLAGVGKGWAARVFFSDNGSTAVEVALKMAFRLAEARRVLRPGSRPIVLGLTDSYHGDTLGACNATSPNLFKARDRWYSPSGVWLPVPRFLLTKGTWQLDLQDLSQTHGLSSQEPSAVAASTLKDLRDIFDFSWRSRDKSVADFYQSLVSKAFEENKDCLGAVLIEPVIHGAGGMVFVDPLFQKILIQEAKTRGVPIIFDEVFSGFWRFGRETAIRFLDETPDIACYSKALTGGAVPLAVTLATGEVFAAFLANTKEQALLHGHSYTANPAACAAACTALAHYEMLKSQHDLTQHYWNPSIIDDISGQAGVSGVVCLGTVLAVTLSANTMGYESNVGSQLTQKLLSENILARALGPVVYLMTHPLASQADCDGALKVLAKTLQAG